MGPRQPDRPRQLKRRSDQAVTTVEVNSLVADVTGEGPAVLLLHGQPGLASDWRAVASLLNSDFRVVIPDRPGYGRSSFSAPGGFASNAEAALALMDHLGIKNFVVGGHSWAGVVALVLRQRVPERVTGTVLVGSVRPGEPLGLLDRLLASRGFGTAAFKVASATLAHPLGRALIERWLGGSARAAMAEMNRYESASTMWASFAKEQRALLTELPELRAAPDPKAGPVVVLTGSTDRVVDPAVAKRLAAELGTTAKLIVVEGAGHLLPRDRPDVIAEAIKDLVGAAGVSACPP